MVNHDELKLCPNCGGRAELHEYEDGFKVICETDSCVNYAARVVFIEAKAAIAAWNKRITLKNKHECEKIMP